MMTAKKKAKIEPKPCQHCKKRRRFRRRNLCWKCYSVEAIRDKYDKYERRPVDFYGDSKDPRPAPTLPGDPRHEAVLQERAMNGEAMRSPYDRARLANLN